MPLQATSGAASYDAFGGGKAVVPQYIEDMFSTYLYDGNDTARSIVNGIDLSTKGGLVWVKGRNLGWSHNLYDTVNGVGIGPLNTSSPAPPNPANNQRVTAFNTDGFSLGTNGNVNGSTYTYASWTFRKQPKFFTQGTFTGDGTTNKVITHDLGGTTGFIIVKRTDSTGNWQCWHRTFTAKQTIFLNTTDAKQTYSGADDITVTDNSFTVGTNQIFGNGSGFTYVYYVFAHNAGGFGLTGTDNVISCGSYTGNSTVGNEINVGYEPQFIIIKRATGTAENWVMFDNMRGIATGGNDAVLYPSGSFAEYGDGNSIGLTATGFKIEGSGLNVSGDTYIYIAIRRGPMKVPTDGTKVYTGSLANPSVSINTGFVPDLAFSKTRDSTSAIYTGTRLQGNSVALITSNTSSEGGFGWQWDRATNTFMQTSLGSPVIDWIFARAPSVMDVVCYTGTGTNTTVTHNLQAVPELIITKSRTAGFSWGVYSQTAGNTKILNLNSDARDASSPTSWNSTTPTATVFSLGTNGLVNQSGGSHVAYLFATCPNVSKVGSYTGTGTTKQIDCGFTAGARFVLIKRIDDIADWYVWDTARGIVSGNDPYLPINANASEVGSTDYIDPYSAGFELSSTAPATLNASGGSYIFLAIA